MNKQKIKELVLATGVVEYDWREDMKYSSSEELVEKLIGVVVRECISVLEEEIVGSIDRHGDNVYLDLILNKHFGVDE
jgi:hypothetical protein